MSRKSDLKVALLLYGQPRFVDRPEAYESIKENILDRYDTTVFAHAWFDPEGNYEELPSWVTDKNGGRIAPPIPVNAVELIMKLYAPRSLRIEKPVFPKVAENVKEVLDRRFQENEFYSERNMTNILSQLLALKMAVTLTDDCLEEFDIFVIARYDAVLQNFPSLDGLNKMTDHKIWVPNGGHYNDLIQIATKSTFVCLYDIYEEMYTLVKHHSNLSEWVELPIPELYKYETMKRMYGLQYLEKLPMYAEVIRT